MCAKGNKFVLRGVQSTNCLLIGSFEYYKSQKVIIKRYANVGTSMQSVRKNVILKVILYRCPHTHVHSYCDHIKVCINYNINCIAEKLNFMLHL